MRLLILATLAIALAGPATAVEQTLKNDSFVTGAPVNFQAGFVTGEIGAVRLVPTIACPCQLKKVTLLFGGNTATRTMGLHVWEDLGGSDPGSELHTASVTMTGSNANFQEVDLTSTLVLVNGPFRVGFEFAHNGLPSLATDTGGIQQGANFILANFFGSFLWFPANTFGLTGDFIIRGTIDNLLPTVVPVFEPWGVAALLTLLLITGLHVLHRSARRPAR